MIVFVGIFFVLIYLWVLFWKCIFDVVCEVRYGDERYSIHEQEGWLLGLLIKLL